MTIKKGDTYPTLRATLTDSAGVPVDLTGASVTFRMVDAVGEQVIADAAVAITNPAAGEVEYAWQVADVDTPGEYRGEFHAVLFGGALVTFPNDAYLYIRILDSLAPVEE